MFYINTDPTIRIEVVAADSSLIKFNKEKLLTKLGLPEDYNLS